MGVVPPPLLSICIPTFNRAELLKLALAVLVDEITGFESKVEIVVSDNCSEDDTNAVVAHFKNNSSVRYHKNDKNIGAAANMLLLATELATGDFVWVIGDDDLVCQGSISNIIKIITSNPDINYFFLNHEYLDSVERARFFYPHRSIIKPYRKRLLCHDTENKRLETWESVINLSDVIGVFTSVVSHIIRRDTWAIASLDVKPNMLFENFDTTFPHFSVAYHAYAGKPIYYIGDPQIIFFTGDQEWFSDSWARIVYTHLLEFTDEMTASGINQKLVRRYRETIFKNDSGSLSHYLGQLPLKKRFVFLLSLLKYSDHDGFYRLIYRTLIKKHFVKYNY